MGISAGRIALTPPSSARKVARNIWIVQLVINILWSPIFFQAQAFGAAFLWLMLLWGIVADMIFQFYRLNPLAAGLQLPYLLWLTFAAYLNGGIWYLNR